MKETTTDLWKLKKGVSFTWGGIIKIHAIGIYSVVEFHPRKVTRKGMVTNQLEYRRKQYHSYVYQKDTHTSYNSLEAAMAGCIAYAFEGVNHHADYYFMRMLKEPRK